MNRIRTCISLVACLCLTVALFALSGGSSASASGCGLEERTGYSGGHYWNYAFYNNCSTTAAYIIYYGARYPDGRYLQQFARCIPRYGSGLYMQSLGTWESKDGIPRVEISAQYPTSTCS